MILQALLTTLLAPLLAFASWVAQPVTATCPRGWWLAMGVNVHTGAFSCHQRVPMAEWPPRDAPEAPTLPGRVWCVPGAARQDGRLVWCAGHRGRS